MTAPLLNPRARGLVGGVRADAGDALAVFNELKATFETFKAERDKELAEIKAGMADVVQTEKVDRINAELTTLSASLDEVNAAIAAMRVGGNGAETANPAMADYNRAFNAWFRRGRGEDELRDLGVRAALSTDSDPDGGYTVPEQMESTVDRILGTVSTMRSLARVITVSTGTYKKLVSQGGSTSGWVGEREARTETTAPNLSALEFPVMELYANPAATQTMLDDSAVDIAQWLADEVAIEFAEEEGAAFITGDGVNKPRGITKYTTVADASWAWGKIGFKTSGVAAALSDATNNGGDALIDLAYSLKQGYRQNARWLMNKTTLSVVRKFKTIGDTEQYLWQPGIAAGEPATILGYPVSDDDNMPDVAANAFPIAFGDFNRGYLIVDRTGVRVLRDPFTNKPYVHFYTTKRVGGGVQNFQAIKLMKVAA